METIAEREARAAQQANEELNNLRNEYKELSDEYLVLKTNHLQLTSDYQNEVAKNEELGLELVHLSNVKEKLLKDKEVVEIETMQVTVSEFCCFYLAININIINKTILKYWKIYKCLNKQIANWRFNCYHKKV